MPILRVYNQATHPGSFSSLILPAFSRADHGGFTYNDSPYIHALNRALQLENAAVAIYAAKQRSSLYTTRSGAIALDRTGLHTSALRMLVGLIFAQRGLPDTDPAGLTAMTGTVAARVSRYMPIAVQSPVLGVSAQRIELALARRYRQLLSIAPEQDRCLITQLLNQVSDLRSQV